LFGGAISDMRALGVHRSISLQVIFGSSVMMIMGASLVYPVLPVIADAFNIGEGNIGLVLMAFTVPAIFLSPVGGMLIDLRGRKQVLVASLLLYGASGLAIVLVDSLPLLLGLRFLQGIAYAGIMPLVVVLIGDTFAKEQETTAQGVKVVLDRMALLLVPAVAGGLGAIAWQLPFALYSVAIPLGFAAWRWLPEPEIVKHSHAPTYVKDVFRASMRVRSLTIFSMSSMRFFLEMSFFIYVPLYAIDRLGVEVSRGGLLFTVFAIGSIATAGMVGTIARRFERFSIVIVAFTLQGVCLGVASVAGSVWVMGVVMLVFGLANGVISPAQKSLLTQSVAGPLRGGFVAADRISQNTAKSLAPLVAGTLVVATSIETMFQVMALVAFGWAAVASALHLRGSLRVVPGDLASMGQRVDQDNS
jgi:MFS transporter, ACDE family, multidrug resistance protein